MLSSTLIFEIPPLKKFILIAPVNFLDIFSLMIPDIQENIYSPFLTMLLNFLTNLLSLNCSFVKCLNIFFSFSKLL